MSAISTSSNYESASGRNPLLILMCGLPSSGKSTFAKKLQKRQYPYATIVSRDILGGAVKDLLPHIESLLAEKKDVIVDNTHLTKESRDQYLPLAKKMDAYVIVQYLETTIEDCQIRYLMRTYAKYNDLFLTTPLPKKDPNVFAPAVLFKARKQLEPPSVDDKSKGYDEVHITKADPPKFEKSKFPNKALFLDIDGTLRETEQLPYKYPTTPEEVVLLHPAPEMREVLKKYMDDGYILIGISNQSGISKGTVTEENVIACMDRTRELLNMPNANTRETFPISYCPHRPAPISCYCRKPQMGLAMQHILSKSINPKTSIMVGDSTSDKTMADRLRMKFIHTDKFWKSE